MKNCRFDRIFLFEGICNHWFKILREALFIVKYVLLIIFHLVENCCLDRFKILLAFVILLGLVILSESNMLSKPASKHIQFSPILICKPENSYSNLMNIKDSNSNNNIYGIETVQSFGRQRTETKRTEPLMLASPVSSKIYDLQATDPTHLRLGLT